MFLDYNAKGVIDRTGIWRAFLAGSLATTSLLIGIVSQSDVMFLAMIALIVAGLMMFMNALMRERVVVFFFETLISFGMGCVIPIAMVYNGWGYPYFAAILLLVIITYVYRFRKLIFSGISKKKRFPLSRS
jgi:hypothetical protein